MIYYILSLLKKYNIAPPLENIYNGIVYYGTSYISPIINNEVIYKNGYFLNPNIFLPINNKELFDLNSLLSLFNNIDYTLYLQKKLNNLMSYKYTKSDYDLSFLNKIYEINNYDLLNFLINNMHLNLIFILQQIIDIQQINENMQKFLFYYLYQFNIEHFFSTFTIESSITKFDNHQLQNLLLNSRNNILSFIGASSGTGVSASS